MSVVMFEGKILQPGPRPVHAGSEFGVDGLRQLGWSELVARFGATREFRKLMREHSAGGKGSFDQSSAAHLAGLGHGQRGINSFALSESKAGQVNESGGDSVSATGDRGR
ncbi:MAG TPA: hypothetical protein VLA37_14780 [Sphingomonadaceae bacterium]|nr:hypothetical protein [Sphingomonadaceae bacterium]